MDNKVILIIGFLVFLASCGRNGTTPISSDRRIVCTQEAMQCPDGSWVGRSGPRCEFVCPRTEPR